MAHKWIIRSSLVALILLAPLYYVVSQQEESVTTLFNRFFNRTNNTLITIPGVAAEGPELSLPEIINRMKRYDEATDTWYMATEGSAGEGSAQPGANTVGPTELQSTTGTPGAYGSATSVPTYTRDADGRMTANAEAPIAIGTDNLINGGIATIDVADGAITDPKLSDTTVTPAIYGSGTEVAQVTFDAKGRATLAANVPITVETSNSLVDEELPLPCTLYTRRTLIPTVVDYLCYQDAPDELEENKRCVDVDPSAPVACWVQTNNTPQPLGDTTHLRFAMLDIAEEDPCTLGSHSRVSVTSGANGKTCFLPDPALDDTAGIYKVWAADDNYLTISPTNGATINGADTPLPPIKGPHAYYEVERVGPTAWNVTTIGRIGSGLPTTTICSKVDGDANTSTTGSGAWYQHSLTCTLPINTLKAGAELEICNGWEFTTGSTAPTQMSWRYSIGETYGASTVLNNSGSGFAIGDSVTSKNIAHCVKLTVGTGPSNTAALYTFPLTSWGHLNSAQVRGTVVQPITADTLGTTLTVFTETQWNTAGSGGAATMKQESLVIRGSGIGD